MAGEIIDVGKVEYTDEEYQKILKAVDEANEYVMDVGAEILAEKIGTTKEFILDVVNREDIEPDCPELKKIGELVRAYMEKHQETDDEKGANA